jgi:hypothetical protein
MATTDGRSGRFERFGLEQAKSLYESGMMSMPEVEPAAPEQMMEWALSDGHVVKTLFGDPTSDGMSLVWSWFGPDFALPRHSHSADCLYYITKGEIHMGRLILGAGEGFFVPSDSRYAYTAGPEGVEILEFRSVSSFDMRISETLPRWAKIVEGVRANQARWKAESPVG